MKTAPLALLFAFTAAAVVAPVRAQTTTSAAAPSADGISQVGSGTARYRVSEATIAWSATPATETALREALGKFGLRERQVSTRPIGPEAVYVWFTVTDLRRLSEILAACERVGGSIGAVTFRGRDDDADRARRAAMRAAVDDARKSAEVWADAAGVRLGKALAISGQSTSASPEGGVPIVPTAEYLRSVKDLKVPESMIASAAVTVRFALPLVALRPARKLDDRAILGALAVRRLWGQAKGLASAISLCLEVGMPEQLTKKRRHAICLVIGHRDADQAEAVRQRRALPEVRHVDRDEERITDLGEQHRYGVVFDHRPGPKFRDEGNTAGIPGRNRGVDSTA